MHKFLKRYGQRGYVENDPRSGRPRKYSAISDRQLIRIVKCNRRKNLRGITNNFNDRTPVKLSESSALWILKKNCQEENYNISGEPY